jgi:hypothetical protein
MPPRKPSVAMVMKKGQLLWSFLVLLKIRVSRSECLEILCLLSLL